MALSFLFSRSFMVARITRSSLSLGILFTSIFCNAHSMQSISNCMSWLNLRLCSGCICFFLFAIFSYKKSLSLLESSVTAESKRQRKIRIDWLYYETTNSRISKFDLLEYHMKTEFLKMLQRFWTIQLQNILWKLCCQCLYMILGNSI